MTRRANEIAAVRLGNGQWRASLLVGGELDVESIGRDEGDAVAALLEVAESRATWCEQRAAQLEEEATRLRRRAAGVRAVVAREKGMGA